MIKINSTHLLNVWPEEFHFSCNCAGYVTKLNFLLLLWSLFTPLLFLMVTSTCANKLLPIIKHMLHMFFLCWDVMTNFLGIQYWMDCFYLGTLYVFNHSNNQFFTFTLTYIFMGAIRWRTNLLHTVLRHWTHSFGSNLGFNLLFSNSSNV